MGEPERMARLEAVTHGRGGRLGNLVDDVGGVVCVEGLDRGARHATRDRLREVPTADADHLGEPGAPLVEQGHDLLGAGAGGGDHTHVAR